VWYAVLVSTCKCVQGREYRVVCGTCKCASVLVSVGREQRNGCVFVCVCVCSRVHVFTCVCVFKPITAPSVGEEEFDVASSSPHTLPVEHSVH
jgi:hypothetical protein